MSTAEATAARPLWLVAAPWIFLTLWSSGFAFAKLGLPYAEPMTFLVLRYAAVLVLLGGIAAVLRPGLPKSRRDWMHLAVVGLLIQALYFGLSYVAFATGVSAAGVALIVCLQPILVGLAAPMVAAEKVSALRWVGLSMGLAGAAIVIVVRGDLAAETRIGVWAAAGALIAISAGTLYEKRFGTAHHPVTANLVQYAVGFAAILPVAATMETMEVTWHPDLAIALAVLVLGNSLISVTLLLAMIRAGEVSRVSALFFLVPPVAALMAWGIIGEDLPPIAWAGMVLACAGVAWARR